MIKVPKSNPMPPMDMQEPPMMDNQEPQGNMDMPMDDMGQNDDFGDEGNGEDTPKKQIQQLTGSLSQDLRTYNDEQQQPDTELNKYVASMIVKQASKALTNKDKDDVIKKLNGNSESDDNEDIQQNEMPMESVRKMANKVVNEILNNSMIDGERKRDNKKLTTKKNYKNPFQSNR